MPQIESSLYSHLLVTDNALDSVTQSQAKFYYCSEFDTTHSPSGFDVNNRNYQFLKLT